MSIEWSFHAGDLILTIFGGIITLVMIPLGRLLVEMRDSLRGLVAQVESHSGRLERIENVQSGDHDAIIKIGAQCPLLEKAHQRS